MPSSDKDIHVYEHLFARLPPKAIAEFKDLYQQEYGEEISDKEAADLFINLLMFYKYIYRRLPKNVSNDNSISPNHDNHV